MTKKFIYILLLWGTFFSAFSSPIHKDEKRASEIRQLMWRSGDKDFDVTVIPEKWHSHSAVIIAKSKRLYYKKPAMSSKLNYFHHVHERIKLLDNAALEQYAQFSIPADGTLGNTSYEFYAGFKIIKPTGKEIEVTLDQAVKESMKLNNSGFDIYKLAIPNLELGDILDYYLCEEQTISIYSKYYSFDPIIFQLHDDDYPIMKQKISFDVLRRCFINLKTLNGAPDFKWVEDTDEDRSSYSLEDSDRESIKTSEWFYPYRELPTIKFKVVYASNVAAGLIPGFIGEPGVIKSKVSSAEIKDLVSYLFSNVSTTSLSYSYLKKEMKTHFKKEKDKIKLAKAAYYTLRNKERIQYAESRRITGKDDNSSEGQLKMIAVLSQFYRDKDIDHDILIGIPRHISSLDDLILENELTFFIRVNAPNPFYISKFNNHSIIGELNSDVQGIKAYQVKGNFPPSSWNLKETIIPVVPAQQNNVTSICHFTISDFEEGKIDVHIFKTILGESKEIFQQLLLDFYDYKDEESERFDMVADFENEGKGNARNLLKQRTDYLATREKNRDEKLMNLLSNDYDLKVDEVRNFKVSQTGRFDENPDFKFEYDASFTGVVKKVGRNYLLDIGKLIEKQVHLSLEDKERKYNIYEPYARSFTYTLSFDIPKGYSVEGIEKLESNIENETGGFISKARVENNKLIVETTKYYSSNYEDKKRWPLLVAFIDAAYNFNQQQVLLKKL